MLKKLVIFGVIFIGLACLGYNLLHAEDSLMSLKIQLNKVRYEMKEEAITNKKDLTAIKDASDKKLSALKKEFHKTRAQYLAERKAQEAQAKAAYNDKLAPLIHEEKRLISIIEPVDTGNFAKKQ